MLANGTAAQLHLLEARLWASDGFNGWSVSIEFVGNFKSVNGKWWRPWRYGADEVPAEQIEAGRELLRELKAGWCALRVRTPAELSLAGNDPGRICGPAWGSGDRSARVLRWGPGYAIDQGKPIPDEWRSSVRA